MLPQLIFQRAESAPPLPSQMSQAALSGGQSLGEGGLLLGGGGGNFCLRGEIPGFPPPCMKPCLYDQSRPIYSYAFGKITRSSCPTYPGNIDRYLGAVDISDCLSEATDKVWQRGN